MTAVLVWLSSVFGCSSCVGYQSTRHTVNSSHTRLVTQSTRYITKPPQYCAVWFNYLSLTSLHHSTDD